MPFLPENRISPSRARLRQVIFLTCLTILFLPALAKGMSLLTPEEIFPLKIDGLQYEVPALVLEGPSLDDKDIRTPEPLTEKAGRERDYVILTAYDRDASVRRMVEKQINLYLTTRRKTFQKWLERSGRFQSLIRDVLEEEGLPPDLVYLPLIESGYRLSARSRARAVGPWQFIAATAKRYGLRINYWLDERRDPVKATRAASRYLRDLYRDFQSWPLALAAYNAGEGRIRYAIRKGKTDDYWKLARSRRYLKRETRYYVSRFIAAGMIAADPEKYGFLDLDYHEPFRFDEVKISSPVSLSFVGRCTGTDTETIRRLNPELKRWCTPPDFKSYTLRVPEGKAGEFLSCYRKASPRERMPRIPYIVKKGDTLYEIAKRYRIPRKELYSMNRGVNPRRLRPGMMIFLPPSESRISSISRTASDPGLVPYTIRKGDTLSGIARRYGVKTRQILALNRTIHPRRLRPGSVIYLPPSE